MLVRMSAILQGQGVDYDVNQRTGSVSSFAYRPKVLDGSREGIGRKDLVKGPAPGRRRKDRVLAIGSQFRHLKQ